MEDLRSSSVKHPVELQFNKLDQVTRKLEVPCVGRVPLGVDIVVLHQPSGVEVVDKWRRWLVRLIRGVLDRIVKDRILKVFLGIEVLIHVVDLRDKAIA